jgi:hypothetical protein
MHPVRRVVELNHIKSGQCCDLIAIWGTTMLLSVTYASVWVLMLTFCNSIVAAAGVNGLTHWHCAPVRLLPENAKENGARVKAHVTYLILRPIRLHAVGAFTQKVVARPRRVSSKIPISPCVEKAPQKCGLGDLGLLEGVDAPMGCDRPAAPINIRFLALRK